MVVVTRKDFISTYIDKKVAVKQAHILERNNILPLHSSPTLSKVVGHLIGDGSLCKDKYIGDFKFYGCKNTLENIRKDIKFLFKIEPSQYYEREGGFVLRYRNCMISRILALCGAPRGNKVMKSFDVPLWIKKGNLEIKKSFIRAICDDEMSSPRLNKKGNVEQLRLKFNKEESLLISGLNFFNSLRNLFIELGIDCSSIKLNNDKYINKYGLTTRSIYINISSKKDNLIRFYNNLNFEDIIKSEKLLNIISK